jgi:hypothetical protein
VAILIAAPAAALTTSSKRYAAHEINFDHANATDWGGTNAGPYQELDCRAALTAAPSDAAQATSIVPRTSGGNNTFKIPLLYDGIVTVGGTNVYRWKLRWSYPRSVDGLRLGIQAVHCGGWGFSVGHILLS